MIPRVLFVDDEQNILSSLRRFFFSENFEVHTALSSESGMKLLHETPIDFVISDFRMPETNGITFLKRVRDEFPNCGRAILSGLSDQEIVLSALVHGIADCYFVKPWENETIAEEIVRRQKIRDLLKEQGALMLIDILERFPPNPPIDTQPKGMEIYDTKMVLSLLKEDILATLRLLKVVNSAYVGIRKTSSIRSAVQILGPETVFKFFLQSDISPFSGNSIGKEKLLELQRHSNIVDCVIEQITDKEKMQDPHSEIPTLGFLTVLPQLLMLLLPPDEKPGIEKLSSSCPALLSLWNLPIIFVEASLILEGKESQIPRDNVFLKALSIAHRATEAVLREGYIADKKDSGSQVEDKNAYSEKVLREQVAKTAEEVFRRL
jgi:DNA-binding NarL/FixJ family response regulator